MQLILGNGGLSRPDELEKGVDFSTSPLTGGSIGKIRPSAEKIKSRRPRQFLESSIISPGENFAGFFLDRCSVGSIQGLALGGRNEPNGHRVSGSILRNWGEGRSWQMGLSLTPADTLFGGISGPPGIVCRHGSSGFLLKNNELDFFENHNFTNQHAMENLDMSGRHDNSEFFWYKAECHEFLQHIHKECFLKVFGRTFLEIRKLLQNHHVW